MLSQPHGGRLVDRVLKGRARERALERADQAQAQARGLPEIALSHEAAGDVFNLATGVFSPLVGFLDEKDFRSVLTHMRLRDGTPWPLPIVLDVDRQMGERLRGCEEALLTFQGEPLALLEVQDVYEYDKAELAQAAFGTTDGGHPGVARVRAMKPLLLGGPISLLGEPPTPFARYRLSPVETRVLFEAKGWRTVVGFQTRNVPHLGHEYVQKTALTFVDGIFINPVIGRKKPGDFTDEAILAAYEALMHGYYLKERVVLAVLQTEMRYAGPREAVFHAILRKNFGCTHFVVGRDHAGVGDYYPPYAAQEIFDRFPDLGIVPLFFTAFFYCQRCRGVANEKTCPHRESERVHFSGTALRQVLLGRGGGQDLHPPSSLSTLIRPEVAEAVLSLPQPFVE